MNKLLLDTNVLIYLIDEGSKYFKKSQNILSEEFELYTTSKNLSEFLSVVTRLLKNSLSLDDALIIVKDFSYLMTILYPDEKSFLIFQQLLRKYKPIGLKIHDFEILSIGLANQITDLVTFNEKDFKEVQEIKLYSI